MLSREQIQIKTPQQVRLMRRAGLVVADIHAALREAVRAGITTAELDAVSAGVIEAAGAHSNFLGYYDYPATVCISVNDEVVQVVTRASTSISPDCSTVKRSLDEVGRKLTFSGSSKMAEASARQ